MSVTGAAHRWQLKQSGAAEHAPQEHRKARDGIYYTREGFLQHYGQHLYRAMWEEARPSFPTPDHSPERGEAQQRGATEHSTETLPLPPSRKHYVEAQQGGATDTHSLPASEEEGDLPLQPIQGGATEHSLVPLLTMQCAACDHVLCDGSQLAFFHRVNKQKGTEVHLMLKPEVKVPNTFIAAGHADSKTLQTWNCPCGAKLGDTRPIGFKKAPMTAFKSANVLLGNRRLTGKKSQWPKVYNTFPFDQIEVRDRDTFRDPSP